MAASHRAESSGALSPEVRPPLKAAVGSAGSSGNDDHKSEPRDNRLKKHMRSGSCHISDLNRHQLKCTQVGVCWLYILKRS
jgi:hypothetical protein